MTNVARTNSACNEPATRTAQCVLGAVRFSRRWSHHPATPLRPVTTDAAAAAAAVLAALRRVLSTVVRRHGTTSS